MISPIGILCYPLFEGDWTLPTRLRVEQGSGSIRMGLKTLRFQTAAYDGSMMLQLHGGVFATLVLPRFWRLTFDGDMASRPGFGWRQDVPATWVSKVKFVARAARKGDGGRVFGLFFPECVAKGSRFNSRVKMGVEPCSRLFFFGFEIQRFSDSLILLFCFDLKTHPSGVGVFLRCPKVCRAYGTCRLKTRWSRR